ncbi:CHRD domain-containing protein [Nitrospira defluvii]|nr:CHRD domain-containing protein [Nitrospira defluvii]
MKPWQSIGLKLFLVTILLVAAGCGDDNDLIPVSTTSTGFLGKLTADQEVTTPATTTATGTGAFSLNAAQTELTFDITVTGLSGGGLTAAHFHNAAAGADGGVVRTLTADFTGNTATGIWKFADGQSLTPTLVTELLAGRIYVNIHTTENTGGEIRGQVLLNP